MLWAIRNGIAAGVEVGVGLELTRYVWANRPALRATWDSVKGLDPAIFMANPVRNGLVTLAAVAATGLLVSAVDKWGYMRSKGVFCVAAALSASLCIGIVNKYVYPFLAQAPSQKSALYFAQGYAGSGPGVVLPSRNRIFVRASGLKKNRLDFV